MGPGLTAGGAGAIIAMASDMRIGTPRAKTGFLFVRVGLAGADRAGTADHVVDHPVAVGVLLPVAEPVVVGVAVVLFGVPPAPAT